MAAPELSRAERIALRISVAQTVLAVVGFLVGIIALYAALNEADAVRKQQQAAVWPYVDVSVTNDNSSDDRFTEVSISNKGIGPARVKTIGVLLDDEPTASWWDLIGKSTELGERDLLLSNADASGRVMTAGESLMLVRIDKTALADDEAGALEVLDQFRSVLTQGRVRMNICYCSVFDDCWKIDTAVAGEPSLVRDCGQNAEGVSF